ncbi:hypothetical protein V8C44DRAFT_321586 [Trichoderma aethiopicum]
MTQLAAGMDIPSGTTRDLQQGKNDYSHSQRCYNSRGKRFKLRRIERRRNSRKQYEVNAAGFNRNRSLKGGQPLYEDHQLVAVRVNHHLPDFDRNFWIPSVHPSSLHLLVVDSLFFFP